MKAFRHYMIVREKRSRVILYQKSFWGDLNAGDEKFYKNLNIDLKPDGTVDFAKVNVKKFFAEWFSLLRRKYDDDALTGIGDEIDRHLRDNDILSLLRKGDCLIYFQPFRRYFDVVRFFDKNTMADIDDRYEFGIMIV